MKDNIMILRSGQEVHITDSAFDEIVKTIRMGKDAPKWHLLKEKDEVQIVIQVDEIAFMGRSEDKSLPL